jgi:fatty aldehyde-generating acyl-ACP reductase
VGREPARLSPPAGPIDFALIGHQESWTAISRLVHALRDARHGPLSEETIREIVPWIPPRTVVRLRAGSLHRGGVVDGIYVESFVTPDELTAGSARRALEKVRAAIRAAAAEGARIATLGGFSSILLEGRTEPVEEARGMPLTTGNSLTAALIVHGVEAAAQRTGIRLAEANLLVVGATGDVGSACARWFAGSAGRLVLAARRADRLARLHAELRAGGGDIRLASEVGPALAEADIVIAAASLSEPALDPGSCRPGTIICDAGYPKNLCAPAGGRAPRLFWGGIGVIGGGWWSDDGRLERFYGFPTPDAGHGCMLEGILLAMEGRYEPFSRGRGNITPDRIREIWTMADRHGIGLAPFFNAAGLWTDQLVARPEPAVASE